MSARTRDNTAYRFRPRTPSASNVGLDAILIRRRSALRIAHAERGYATFSVGIFSISFARSRSAMRRS